jgi:hypothetical protein
MELLERSLASIDYLGNWSDPEAAQDSIVESCLCPSVVHNPAGPEYSCVLRNFTPERAALHGAIVQRLLTSARTTGTIAYGAGPPSEGRRKRAASALAAAAAAVAKRAGIKARRAGGQSATSAGSEAAASGASASSTAAGMGGPPALSVDPQEEHVFLVVGVPGSGKDTVLKRYLRSLGLPLIDASADLVKEYLAAWADDELSNEVRRNNEARGPGKHLLHAQYLHRESIHIVDTAVTEARRRGESLLLEKTLFNVEPVLAYARAFRQCESPARRGRRVNVHLLGTVVSPRQNWAFLRERMTSGRSFGRYAPPSSHRGS